MMNNSIALRSLSVMYENAQYQSPRRGISNVREYYDILCEGLKIKLLAKKLLATGELQKAPTREERAFSLVCAVAESAAYAAPGGAVLVHLSKEAAVLGIELAHFGVLTFTHGLHAAESIAESLHHEPQNNMLRHQTDEFVKDLSIRLGLRFRHEIKLLDRKHIIVLANMHRDYILKRIIEIGEQQHTQSLQNVCEQIINEIAPDPFLLAESEVKGYLENNSNHAFAGRINQISNTLSEVVKDDRKGICQLLFDSYTISQTRFELLSTTPKASSQYSLTNPIVTMLHPHNELAKMVNYDNRRTVKFDRMTVLFDRLRGSQMKSFIEIGRVVNLCTLRALVINGAARRNRAVESAEYEQIILSTLSNVERNLILQMQKQGGQVHQLEKQVHQLGGQVHRLEAQMEDMMAVLEELKSSSASTSN